MPDHGGWSIDRIAVAATAGTAQVLLAQPPAPTRIPTPPDGTGTVTLAIAVHLRAGSTPTPLTLLWAGPDGAVLQTLEVQLRADANTVAELTLPLALPVFEGGRHLLGTVLGGHYRELLIDVADDLPAAEPTGGARQGWAASSPHEVDVRVTTTLRVGQGRAQRG